MKLEDHPFIQSISLERRNSILDEIKIEIAYVSFDTLFEHFRELNSPFFKDDRVQFELSGNGASTQGDASKLMRVLQNLIGNAIDALHNAKIEGLIEVVAKETDGSVILTVSDNGPGIPQSIRETFFEPFVTQGKNEGTGLGSAIVKTIIEAHRGSITFETSAQGTTFTIRLPKQQA
jgi:signal transduction histidine kinase